MLFLMYFLLLYILHNCLHNCITQFLPCALLSVLIVLVHASGVLLHELGKAFSWPVLGQTKCTCNLMPQGPSLSPIGWELEDKYPCVLHFQLKLLWGMEDTVPIFSRGIKLSLSAEVTCQYCTLYWLSNCPCLRLFHFHTSASLNHHPN